MDSALSISNGVTYPSGVGMEDLLMAVGVRNKGRQQPVVSWVLRGL